MARVVPLASEEDIPLLADNVWLYTGAEGPPLAAQGAAAAAYLTARGQGATGRQAHNRIENRVRARVASLVGLNPGDVALLGNASEAINVVAACVDAMPGDNIVLNEFEYPSMVQPWIPMTTSGVEVRVARRNGWAMPADAITALIDARTKVVAISQVSYLSGWRHDLKAISDAATAVGALLVVDATQALGVVPVPSHLIDVVISSSYKWLLGGHGVGILAWNQARRPLPTPTNIGWRSVPDIFTRDRFERYELHRDARRFEVGFPSYPSLYSLDCALGWLEQFDPAVVEHRVLALTAGLISGLTAQGWEVMTPTDPARRAGNVAVRAPDGARMAEELARRHIHAWGGDGRLRFSLHLFNVEDDVDELLDALSQLHGSGTQGLEAPTPGPAPVRP